MSRPSIVFAVVAVVLATATLASANTEVWTNSPGISLTTNWSDNANWINVSGGGGPGFTNNDVLFGNAGASSIDNTINSVVDTTSVSFSLTFTNQSSLFHTVLIPAGQTLTNANGLTVGTPTAIDANSTKVNFVGGGTLIQLGNTMTVRNNCSGSGQNSLATLDLSGLTNFVLNSISGSLNISGTGTETRSAGALTLAGGSNNITVGTINLVTTSGNGGNAGGSNFRLGPGTNVINVGTFNIEAGKANSGTVSFQGAAGGLRLRGINGSSDDTSRVGTISIENRNTGGTGTTSGTLDLTGGHSVDIKATNIIVGQATSNPTSATQNGTGTLKFDTGTIDVLAIGMATNTVANANTVGSITLGANANLTVGAGGITLVNQTAGTATGSLTNNGGTIQTSGPIRKGNANGTANVTVNGGVLMLNGTANPLGTTAAPINNITLGDSKLTLPAVPSAICVASTLNLTSSTNNTINISSVSGVSSFPAQFPLISYSTLNGAFDFVLGTLPGTYQGYISNNSGALSVDLVVTNSQLKFDVWNGNVNSNWDAITLNWISSSSSTNFQPGDIVTFDDSLTGTTNVYLTTALPPGAVNFTNSSHDYVLFGTGKISGTASLAKDGSRTTTLSGTGGDNFSGGVVVYNGNLILDNTNSAITGGLVINGGTTQIGNSDAGGGLPAGGVTDNGLLVFKRVDSFTVGTPINGSGALTHSGTGTLTLTASNGFTGLTTIQNGTLALSGSGTLASSSGLAISSGGFNISSLSAPTTLGSLSLTNATITVAANASGVANISSTTLAFGGTSTLNATALPAIASYPVSLPIIQSGAAASGTFSMNVGTLPAATPAYAANVTLSADQMTVLLNVTAGPVGVRPQVGWTGADVANLNTNWSDRLNWQLPGEPSFGENALFNNTGAESASALSTPGGGSAGFLPGNINNIVDNNVTASSLTYTNLGSAIFHNTLVNPARTLMLTNSGLIVGAVDSAQADQVSISGANASLSVQATNGNVQVWVGSGSSSAGQATLDMSALDNFSASVSRLLVGATINNVVNRPSGILYLAKTNSISAGFQTTTTESGTGTANAGIDVGDCNQNPGSASYLYLGQVNTISADTIAIGRQKASGHMQFNSIYANTPPYPSVTIQGFSSSLVSIFDLADAVGNGGTTAFSADCDLSGGRVTAFVDRMNVGRGSTNGTAANATTGTLIFDAGAITVNTLNVGFQPVSGARSGVGGFGVNSNSVIGAAANLIVRGTLNLGQTGGGAGATTTSGTLGITNGTAFAFSVVPGTGSVSTVTLAGGNFVVSNSVGDTTTPLTTLNLLPLGTSDNSATTLNLPVGLGNSGITVTTLNIDGQATTTNVINVESVGPVGPAPLELPLVKYGTMNLVNGSTTNIGLGTLPTGYAGYFTNDTTQSTLAVVLTSVVNPQPVMTNLTVISATTISIRGRNGFANRPYLALASTNVTLPIANWTAISTNVFGANGNFSFTAPFGPTTPARFFRLQVQ